MSYQTPRLNRDVFLHYRLTEAHLRHDESLLTRRRHPRLEIDGPYIAHDVTRGHWVRLCNISEGGFQTEARQIATIGDTHTFRAQLTDGQHAVLEATAVHCQVVNGEVPRCLVGWKLTSHDQNLAAIRTLIDDVTTLSPIVERSQDEDSAWAFQTESPHHGSRAE